MASYLHASPASGLGRIGTLVAIEAKQKPLPDSVRDTIQVSISHSETLALHNKPSCRCYLIPITRLAA